MMYDDKNLLYINVDLKITYVDTSLELAKKAWKLNQQYIDIYIYIYIYI